MNMDKTIIIRPKSLRKTIVWVCVLLLPVALFVGSFLVLLIEKNYLGFALILIISIIMAYLFAKPMLWKVSFIENKIFAPKTHMQIEKLDVECSQILSCNVGWYDLLHACFLFDCVDGKKRGLVITLFSIKQKHQILEMIKARGGLQTQDSFDEIIKHANGKNK